jgi:hypothetical protein
MEPLEDKLESGSITIMGLTGPIIDPAKITMYDVPDLSYTMLGGVSLSGSASPSFYLESSKSFSWKVNGFVSKELFSSWNTGEGELYWYRIETECKEITCEEGGLANTSCKSMTTVTFVAARNMGELCVALNNPTYNPPLKGRISSVKRYSRPVLKDPNNPDECNILIDQNFCNVAECLDYCLNGEALEQIFIKDSVVESILERRMSGGLSIRGRAWTNQFRPYDPEFPVVGISGSFFVFVRYDVSAGPVISLSGSSPRTFSNASLPVSGGMKLGGFSQTTSPDWNYESRGGGFSLSGRSVLSGNFTSRADITVFGSASVTVSSLIRSAGGITLSGGATDYLSPYFSYRPRGGMRALGESYFGFQSAGLFQEYFGMDAKVFDIRTDFVTVKYDNSLTISSGSVNPSCGCGPVALSLSLRTNLANSAMLGSFLTRNGISLDEVSNMRYRSSDSSWTSSTHFSGYGRGGVLEDWSLFFSLVCNDSYWAFSFAAKSSGDPSIGELQTKFILDIPSDIICSDNNISTNILMNINSGQTQTLTGISIPAVSPARAIPANPSSRGVDVFVDGISTEYRIYYDSMGLFKDSYWSSNALQIGIQTAAKPQLPSLELYRIF